MPKRRQIIALAEILTVFDDACIRKLAAVAKLPAGADLEAFGLRIRDAAEMFVRESGIPTANELHQEITALYKAAVRRNFEEAALLLNKLSPEALTALQVADPAELRRSSTRTAVENNDRSRRRSSRILARSVLPAAGDLRNVALRDGACVTIESLCRTGARLIKGRRRPFGKQSRPVVQPFLKAPSASTHFPKRETERQFVARLSAACQVVGRAPPRTVRHRVARESGPFVRFVDLCLDLVGVGYADVVELINAVGQDSFYQKMLGKQPG